MLPDGDVRRTATQQVNTLAALPADNNHILRMPVPQTFIGEVMCVQTMGAPAAPTCWCCSFMVAENSC